ncbi:BnaCnng55120D [Brassica napus]|uniref:BnaCnng55120D protein n=1 Tax=Brassica napus TaxID=3708 RepID=A0A078JPZ6_BRANA|nr:BnaCnng55120D [Brassica napus]
MSRLSIPIDREQLIQRGASILESGRLQDVGPIQNRLSLPQLSPIRSLSEDRRHVFERLGDANLVGNADEDGEIPVDVNPVAPPLQVARSTAASRAASKAAGKRIATERATTTKKRTPLAPPTGVSVKRRRVTRVQNSPKRKVATGNQPAKKGTKAPGGSGCSPTVRRLRELRRKFSPDIMFLMETKNQDETVLKLFEKSNLTNHFTVPLWD